MPLETGNSIPDLNASNPAHTDGINAGDAHIRLIKSALKNTFPNFTNAGLSSTQSAIDAAVGSLTGVFKVAVDGTISAPAYTFASETGLGFYRKATNTLALAIAGVDVWKISGGGVDVITAGALLAGGTPIFPLQTANIGAAQVTGAKIGSYTVTYGNNGNLQLSAAANVLLGSTAIGGFFGEVTLGSGLAISVGVLNTTFTAPTLTTLTSGTSYNVPSGCKRLHVRMIGGGAGGGAGGAGGATSFNSVVANAGATSSTVTGGAGGSGGTGSPTNVLRIAGGAGLNAGTISLTGSVQFPPAAGGTGPFGSGGPGAGGLGSYAVISSSGSATGGGGAGEYVEFDVIAPVGPYTYAIGAAGTAGTNATAGKAGIIVINEYYS